jgi:hypothetical protein
MRSVNIFSASMLLLVFSGCGSTSGEDMGLATGKSESGLDLDRSAESAEVAAESRFRAHAIATPRGPSEGPEQLVGSWISPSCGERTYARKIQFNSDGTFGAQDLVSPCPPDVVCLWSGILYHRGSYEVLENKIRLQLSEPRSRVPAWSFPTTLEIDPATGAPMEGSADGELCVYTREPEAPR